MKASNVIKHLLVSQTRQKLISIFFTQPGEIFYVRQLVRMTEEEINSVRRELENLKKAGILESEWRSNRLFYWASKNNPFFTDLLIIANKISGLGHALQEKKVGQIRILVCDYAFLAGEEKVKNSIDFILVGDVSSKEVDSIVKAEEQKRQREINYMIMDKSELQVRRLKRDPFIVDFFLNCPLVIIGSPKDII
jgi:hypothetical protein